MEISKGVKVIDSYLAFQNWLLGCDLADLDDLRKDMTHYKALVDLQRFGMAEVDAVEVLGIHFVLAQAPGVKLNRLVLKVRHFPKQFLPNTFITG